MLRRTRGMRRAFGTPSADPYLAKTLPRMGALLENYYAIGHASADNYIAQVSGQAPDLGTQADCPLWVPRPTARSGFLSPGHVVAWPYHQVLGEGCVYPAAVPTLGNQLSACSHPATCSADRTRHAERGDQYAARHDGFAFFQSVTANPAFCAVHILSFRPLPGDLTRASVTTAFSFLLAPNLCNDGHDAPCDDGAPVGLAQADRFPARVGAGHHRHAGLPGRRTDRDHLRRRQRHDRLLRRDLRPRPLPSQRAAALPA